MNLQTSGIMEPLDIFDTVKAFYKKKIITLLCSVKKVCPIFYDNLGCTNLIIQCVLSDYYTTLDMMKKQIRFTMLCDRSISFEYDRCINTFIHSEITKLCSDYKKYSDMIGWIVIPTKLGTRKGLKMANTRIDAFYYKLLKCFNCDLKSGASL